MDIKARLNIKTILKEFNKKFGSRDQHGTKWVAGNIPMVYMEKYLKTKLEALLNSAIREVEGGKRFRTVEGFDGEYPHKNVK